MADGARQHCPILARSMLLFAWDQSRPHLGSNLETTGAGPMHGRIQTPLRMFPFWRIIVSCLLCGVSPLLTGSVHAGDRAPSQTIHLVQSGETLYSLSKRYHVSLPALLDANGITSPNALTAGTRLRIPTAHGATAQRKNRLSTKTATMPETLRADWKSSETKYGIMGIPPQDAPPSSGSITDIPLRHGAVLSPEHRDPGAVIMAGAANKKEDFQGHSVGMVTRIPAGKDTQFVTTMGYAVDVSVNKSDASKIGYQTDTSIGGLGYGLGLRHSF
ncbi:LysM peptidoglycan-binding domain-containing protein [Desulfolutivibrio sulfoxidireducens]|nr:LysM peptidoglycan-binding domain-containing protein [Desulfolutivibrio sulfoxidireducens]